MKRNKYGINTDLQDDYTWALEDWQFLAILVWACVVAFGTGLLTGLVWAAFL
jgi:hypothetical protein